MRRQRGPFDNLLRSMPARFRLHGRVRADRRRAPSVQRGCGHPHAHAERLSLPATQAEPLLQPGCHEGSPPDLPVHDWRGDAYTADALCLLLAVLRKTAESSPAAPSRLATQARRTNPLTDWSRPQSRFEDCTLRNVRQSGDDIRDQRASNPRIARGAPVAADGNVCAVNVGDPQAPRIASL
jgi:hypothetical protein